MFAKKLNNSGDRGDRGDLRHTHFHFPPYACLSLILHADPPVSEISDEPTLQVGAQIGLVNFLEQTMVDDNIEGLAQVDT